jgi:ATP/maltotriose-dependent transcriptional regulator MalT
MPETLLRTKLYIPPLLPNLVPRPFLIERLNQGLQPGRKLTLISAPAGFGKTTLVAEWLNQKDEGGRLKDEETHDQIQLSTLRATGLRSLKQILHPCA